MIKIDMRNKQCPLPVIETKKMLKENLNQKIMTVVDNIIAVENLQKLGNQMNCDITVNEISKIEYEVILFINENSNDQNSVEIKDTKQKNNQNTEQNTIVVISSEMMGSGDELLGKTLLKGYIYALTQLDVLPDYILLYNGGVHLSINGADTLQDLIYLQANGTKIASCGACLDYYNQTKNLGVGEITNMYAIAELLSKATRIIKP